METWRILGTGTAALLFALVFLVGGRIYSVPSLVYHRRSVVSFSAGISLAYVFMHTMPELAAARREFADSVSVPLRYEGMAIYFLALGGFMAFYGLDHLWAHARQAVTIGQDASRISHLGAFSAYVSIMAYLLVHNLEKGASGLAVYAVAIFFHFLALDHALREQHGIAYERRGRFVLALASAVGWGLGTLVVIPPGVMALLVAFISGAVVVNSAIMELPSEKDGRLWPFIAGGLLYGLLLLPLG